MVDLYGQPPTGTPGNAWRQELGKYKKPGGAKGSERGENVKNGALSRENVNNCVLSSGNVNNCVRQAGRQTATQPHGQADGEQADSQEIQQNIAASINFGYSYSFGGPLELFQIQLQFLLFPEITMYLFMLGG